jgi:hypothetical protein
MTTLTNDEQFAILRKDICQCGRGKRRGYAFCRGCFHRLTQAARDALYTRVPGFAVAYLIVGLGALRRAAEAVERLLAIEEGGDRG